ncbi:MAG: hypothetical protein NT045_05620, partial [Candidatus Aureabacteria bacterium]|nr:hypothetical protein [Candidatus Auribacterota bacterium]
MKKIALVMSMMLLSAGAAQAALEGGDVLVLDTSANPLYSLLPIPFIAPTPLSSRLFNVKPNKTVETLKEFGLYEDIRSVAVAPDGSIIAVRAGNWTGGPTPTPDPGDTPVPAGFYQESAVYRIQPDGSSTIIAQGGLLNPLIDFPIPFLLPITLMGSAVDEQGTIYLSHGLYGTVPGPGTPTPHPAILKLSPDGSTLSEFAYGNVFTSNQLMSPALALDADGNLFTSLYCSYSSPAGTPTPLPGKIIKVNPQGTPSLYAEATPVGDPYDDVSHPFSSVRGFEFDNQGTLLMGAMYPEDSPSPFVSISQSSVQSVAPDGSFTSLVASSQLGGYGPAAAFCTDGEGTFIGANQNAGAMYA